MNGRQKKEKPRETRENAIIHTCTVCRDTPCADRGLERKVMHMNPRCVLVGATILRGEFLCDTLGLITILVDTNYMYLSFARLLPSLWPTRASSKVGRGATDFLTVKQASEIHYEISG